MSSLISSFYPPAFKTTTQWLRLASLSFVALLLLCCCGNGFCETLSPTDLHKQFETIAKAANGKVGAAAELLETRESVTLNGQQPFPMQSTYKFPIGMAVLHLVDEGKLKLDQVVHVTTNDFVIPWLGSRIRDEHPNGVDLTFSDLLQKMVSESDGTASDILLRMINGPASVTRYLQGLGVTNVVVATTEKEMGEDELAQYRSWASPEGMNALLRLFYEGRGLSSASRMLLMRFMKDTPTGQHRLKGLLPAGTPVRHKTGTSGTINGLARATNDAGIITLPDNRHLLITVFVSDSPANETTREAVIAKISRAAWDYWVKKPQ